VLEDLPEKRRELVYLSGDLIDNKMKQLRKAREELQRNDRLSNVWRSGRGRGKVCHLQDRQVKTQSFMEYYVLTGQAKMGAVAQHLVDTYFYQDAPEKKVLVFAHHLPVLDHLAVQLAKAVGAAPLSSPDSHSSDLCRASSTSESMVPRMPRTGRPTASSSRRTRGRAWPC
jgi:hypothetical protein